MALLVAARSGTAAAASEVAEVAVAPDKAVPELDQDTELEPAGAVRAVPGKAAVAGKAVQADRLAGLLPLEAVPPVERLLLPAPGWRLISVGRTGILRLSAYRTLPVLSLYNLGS